MSLLSLVALSLLGAAQAPAYDIVLKGGRVMDPESGLDAVRHVGIRGDRIAAVSGTPLRGKTVVDVQGLVVAPGFIDLHAHGQDLEDNKWQARDGVTTALEMEAGVWPVAEWYRSREGTAVVNYGATVGHIASRVAVKTGARTLGDVIRERQVPGPAPRWSHQPLDSGETDQLLQLLRQGLDEGALGVGMGIAYTPAASREEIYRVFQLAAERRVAIHVHVRASPPNELGDATDAVQEMLADAAATGASLHVVHLGSSGLGRAPLLARMIEGARKNGIDVTTEVYPWTAGSTFIQSAVFDSGWQQRNGGIGYQDLQWPATGERLTEESFTRYRKEGGWVILHMIPESTVDFLVARPGIMIASDGVPIVNGRGHPRGVGTYARVLGRFVREKKALGLMDALRKMSLLPAERVRTALPAMGRKGRIKAGADADITVFDPARVIERATYENPAQASEGIPYVLVNGAFVVREGKLVEGATPGRAVRRAPAATR